MEVLRLRGAAKLALQEGQRREQQQEGARVDGARRDKPGADAINVLQLHWSNHPLRLVLCIGVDLVFRARHE